MTIQKLLYCKHRHISLLDVKLTQPLKKQNHQAISFNSILVLNTSVSKQVTHPHGQHHNTLQLLATTSQSQVHV